LKFLFFLFFLFLNLYSYEEYLNLTNKISISKQHGFSEFELFNGVYILDNKENINRKYKLTGNCTKVVCLNENIKECFEFKSFYLKSRKIEKVFSIKISNNDFIPENSSIFNSFFIGNYFELYKTDKIRIKKITEKKELIKELYKDGLIKRYFILGNKNTKLGEVISNNFNKIIEFEAICKNKKCSFSIKFKNKNFFYTMTKNFYNEIKGK